MDFGLCEGRSKLLEAARREMSIAGIAAFHRKATGEVDERIVPEGFMKDCAGSGLKDACQLTGGLGILDDVM